MTEKAPERTDEDTLAYVYGVLLSTAEGRLFLHHLLSLCGVYNISHHPKSNALDTAFREGARSIGLQVQDQMLNADPKAFVYMLEEARNKSDD